MFKGILGVQSKLIIKYDEYKTRCKIHPNFGVSDYKIKTCEELVKECQSSEMDIIGIIDQESKRANIFLNNTSLSSEKLSDAEPWELELKIKYPDSAETLIRIIKQHAEAGGISNEEACHHIESAISFK